MAHSLPFVEWDERRNRFSVNEKAAEYLSSLDERLGAHDTKWEALPMTSMLFLTGNGGP